MTIQLKLEIPSKEAPGYLRRLDASLKFMNALNLAKNSGNYPDDLISGIIQFLLPFITIPADRKDAEEALWNCSEDQFEGMINSITGAQKEIPFQKES